MKKHWVNPNCQNSEPTKRTVSNSAKMILQFAGSKLIARPSFNNEIFTKVWAAFPFEQPAIKQ